METLHIFSPEQIKLLLVKSDLKELSKQTGIKYGTLKNYAYGQSKVENMPLSMAQILTQADRKYDFFNNNRHISVSAEMFRLLKSKLNIGSTAEELINARILVHHRLSGDSVSKEPFYCFISLHELSLLDMDLSFLATSLGLGIRFVIYDDRKNFQDYYFGKDRMTYDQLYTMLLWDSYRNQTDYFVEGADIVKDASFSTMGLWPKRREPTINYLVLDVTYMRPFDIYEIPVTDDVYMDYINLMVHNYIESDDENNTLIDILGNQLLKYVFKSSSWETIGKLCLQEDHEMEAFLGEFLSDEDTLNTPLDDCMALGMHSWRRFKEKVAERPIQLNGFSQNISEGIDEEPWD